MERRGSPYNASLQLEKRPKTRNYPNGWRNNLARSRHFAWILRFSDVRCLRSAMALAERRPCFQGALRQRSRPSGVCGPVEAPPCIRQRVDRPVFGFRIAGARHFFPLRVLAPQRGAVDGSPAGLPCFRSPRCLPVAIMWAPRCSPLHLIRSGGLRCSPFSISWCFST